MDIPALSTMVSQGSVGTQASMLVMRKVLDNVEQSGQATISMMASAAPSISPAHLGQSIDISA